MSSDTKAAAPEADIAAKQSKYALDVFIRMNLDEEKDYCFQVFEGQTFGDLIKIFEVLPLNLSPGPFYERVPIGFQVSRCPGYLTNGGGVLFGRGAEDKEWLSPVSNSDLVTAKVWPGQLLMPVWKEDTFFKNSIYAFLLTWLYTDLPEFLSPTPGIGATTWLVKGCCYVIRTQLNNPEMAQKLSDEILAPTGRVAQSLFFAFHLLKILVIWCVFNFGVVNPYSFVSKPPAIDRDSLISIGWTGTRKATIEDFINHYRDYKIKEVGGILKAHQLGLLDKFRSPGVELGKTEGYNTPLELVGKLTLDKLRSQKKFQLCLDYFNETEANFHKLNAELDDNAFGLEYKNFKRYGDMNPPEKLADIINARVALGAGSVDE